MFYVVYFVQLFQIFIQYITILVFPINIRVVTTDGTTSLMSDQWCNWRWFLHCIGSTILKIWSSSPRNKIVIFFLSDSLDSENVSYRKSEGEQEWTATAECRHNITSTSWYAWPLKFRIWKLKQQRPKLNDSASVLALN